MLGRFLGERGRRLRVEALASQKIVAGNRELAEELADRVEVFSVPAGETLITQGGGDNAIYFVLSGVFDVNVNGRKIAARGPNEHVGEMAAVQPAQRRSANVVAAEGAIVAQLTAEAFTDLGNRYPQIFRCIAQELAGRLLQRNALVGSLREKIRSPYRVLNRSFAYSPCCSKRVCERPLHCSRLDGRSLPRHELSSRNLRGAN